MVAPLVELEVVDDSLLLDVVVCVDVLGDFADGDLACAQLFLSLGSQLIHGCLHVLHRLVHHFLVLLLEVEEFVTEEEKLSHLGGVVHRQVLDHLLLLLDLLFELLDETVILGADTSNLGIFFSDEVL